MAGAITAVGVGKRFSRYATDRPTTLKQAMLRGWRHTRRTDSFWALREVDFNVAPGSVLGVVGHNGSGKSTLLRLLGGVMRPDEGRIDSKGQVIGLLELNAGIHPELSGRENLVISGVLAGLTHREVTRKFDEMVAFAGLEDSIDSPVRTYSAGMKLRLGFAAAVHGRPGILLIDEVLSVGDGAFQAKCLDRIRRYQQEGSAIVVATHDLGQMAGLCDSALWLKRGMIAKHGAAQEVAGTYRVEMARQMLQLAGRAVADQVTRSGAVLRFGENRFGSLEQEILSVRLTDAHGDDADVIETGGCLTVEVVAADRASVGEPRVVVAIGTQTSEDVVNLSSLAGPEVAVGADRVRRATLSIDRLDLAAGDYFVNVGIYQQEWRKAFDVHWRCYPLKVTAGARVSGLLLPPHRWRCG